MRALRLNRVSAFRMEIAMAATLRHPAFGVYILRRKAAAGTELYGFES